MTLVPADERIEPLSGSTSREPHHDAGVPPRLTAMNDPDDISIPMHLDARNDTLPKKTLRMVSLDEQGLCQVHRARLATSRVAAHGSHTNHVAHSRVRHKHRPNCLVSRLPLTV